MSGEEILFLWVQGSPDTYWRSAKDQGFQVRPAYTRGAESEVASDGPLELTIQSRAFLCFSPHWILKMRGIRGIQIPFTTLNR